MPEMKRLTWVVAALLLVAFSVTVMAAGEKPEQRKRRAHVAGVVKSVEQDGDTLKSFVLTTGRKKQAQDVSVTVDANTKYFKGEKGKQGKREPATAADVVVGARLVAMWKGEDKTGPAAVVFIVVTPAPE
jgi:hypothetical protein